MTTKMKTKKIFRSFEIITEFRNIAHSDKNIFLNIPKIASLFFEYQFLSYYFGGVPKWRVMLRKLISKKRIVPNYVMTGPIKSGSSDLVSHLLMHPNIMSPLAKEIDSLNAKQWQSYFPTIKQKQALEAKLDSKVSCGYLEPALHDIQLINKLYDLNPNSKIVITLRDPIDRAFSQWKWEAFLTGKDYINNPSFNNFDDYIKQSISLFPSVPMQTVCGFPVMQTGIYYQAVKLWMDKFGKDNVLVLDIADYFKNRKPVLKEIQTFLDLPDFDIQEYQKIANENPLKVSPAQAETNALLSEFYRPYNKQLFDLIGKQYQWK
ncbi:sulfotransferase domain-containing protein [Marinicellulosiphila megalodicopiae]|uniref:sulfotransferase domain-containing protein n=1 Tax=Marinicellulosiphila megalodicopiae TaxID=2724896 RepID=UPI003BB0E442